MDQGLIDSAPARSQRGFTLIEMMITVVVIAILAAVVVPMFMGESRKSKSSTEVAAMFAEFSVKEEQAHANANAYLALATACPATPSAQGNPSAPCAASAEWVALRVAPTMNTLYCSYTITVGTGTGTSDPSGFTWASPATDWWYAIATCDMDNDTAVDSSYFTSSSDSQRQVQNEGK